MRILLSLIFILIFISPAYGFEFHAGSIHPEVGKDRIAFGIYDSNGNYTGYDINNFHNEIRNLKNFLSGSVAEGDDGAGDVGHITNFLYGLVPDGTAGTYKLAIYGLKLNTYFIDGFMAERKSKIGKFTIPGIIDIGQVRYVEIKYTPGQNPIITRIATISDLLGDITTAQKLNLIGNAHFVSEIIEKINEIEKERTKPPEKDDDHKLTPAQKAKKEYTELLGEITEKYNKPEGDEFVKQEAYTVLSEDIEYIISHIQ